MVSVQLGRFADVRDENAFECQMESILGLSMQVQHNKKVPNSISVTKNTMDKKWSNNTLENLVGISASLVISKTTNLQQIKS